MECKFFLHKSCMKSIPRQLINHRIHPCTLIFITFPFWDECDCCGERIVSHMRFSCGACDLNLHVKCALFPTIDSEDAKEIQHFSHPHTLALVQNNEEYGSEPRCVACAQICLPPAPTFRCSRSCNHFFLHKSCYVKLPYKSINFKHPFHPGHSLTITSLPYNHHIRTCYACCRGIDSTLLAYSCRESECKFNLHLDCYKPLPSITFSGHQHPLTLLEKTADVTCHLCGVNCRNFILRCLPYDEFYCDACEQKRNQRELIYYCAECKFIVEVKCVFSEVLSSLFEDNSFEKKRILMDDVTQKVEFYPETKKWQVENLLQKYIRLEAKMKQLQGELDGVTNKINRTKVLLGNLVGGSSEFLFQLVKNNSQLRDLFNSAENQGLMINWNGNNNCQELVNHHNRNWWSSLVGGSTNNSDDELDDYDVSDYDYY
ncbi:hypothetical protein GOBAR_AA35706 [Gossypium barbadense]|uniref:DC1 domain-containing protein n=1 Tax=Gossypium barbadense TaxID=3634 RepID=A0A2P5W1R9_GOSBA|nr:hypothetical protein GOBAR_AA35706 [Gossypium barbadense]